MGAAEIESTRPAPHRLPVRQASSSLGPRPAWTLFPTRPLLAAWPLLLLLLALPAMALGQPSVATGQSIQPALQPQITQALRGSSLACQPLETEDLAARHGRLSFTLHTLQQDARSVRVDLQPGTSPAFCWGGNLALSYVGPARLDAASCLLQLCQSLDRNAALAQSVHSAIQQQSSGQPPLAAGAAGFPWGWVLLTLALLSLAGWGTLRLVNRRLFTYSTPVLLAVALLLTLSAFLDLTWETSWSALPWLLLPLLAVATVVHALRWHGRKTLLLLAVTAGSLTLRCLWDWLPVNWYYDFTGPAGASDVFLRREGGTSLLFRLLSDWMPLSAGSFFVASAVASALGASLMALAMIPCRPANASRKPVAPGFWLVWALLLAIDPLQLVLGASGAVHTWALLAFGTGFYWFQVVRSRPARHPAIALTLALTSAALVGWTRPELSWYILAYPVLSYLASWLGPQAAENPAPPSVGLPTPSVTLQTALLLVALASTLLPALSKEHGYATSSVDFQVLAAWAHSLLPPFLPSPWLILGDFDFNPVATQTLFSVLFLAFLAGCWLSQRRKCLLLLPVMALLTLPRLFTPFHKFMLAGPLPTWRYDILLNPMLLLTLAIGAAFLTQVLLRLWHRWPHLAPRGLLAAAATLLLASGAFQHPLLNGSLAAQPPLPFQAEYHFLMRNLPNVPPGATLVAPWIHGWEQDSPHDIDAVLATPHSLLAFQRPDIHWVTLDPQTHSLPPARPLFWFENAFCGLDLAHPHGPYPASAAEQFAALQAHCRLLHSDPALRWVDEQQQTVSPTGGVLQLPASSILLRLGQVRRGF